MKIQHKRAKGKFTHLFEVFCGVEVGWMKIADIVQMNFPNVFRYHLLQKLDPTEKRENLQYNVELAKAWETLCCDE